MDDRIEPGDPSVAGARARRGDRQARVGILRNPNGKPMPPPRRPPLIGRWLHLRSMRRPAGADPASDPWADVVPDPLPPGAAAFDPGDVVVQGHGGGIDRIDVDRLMNMAIAAVPPRPARPGYAAHLLADRQIAPVAGPRPVDACARDRAPLAEDEVPPVIQTAPPTSALGRLWSRLRGF